MTTTPQEPLGDDEITTEDSAIGGGNPAADADGTDSDSSDSDSSDSDSSDGSDADGTDGAAL